MAVAAEAEAGEATASRPLREIVVDCLVPETLLINQSIDRAKLESHILRKGSHPSLGMGLMGNSESRGGLTDLPEVRAPLGVPVIEVVAGEAEALP